MLCSDARGSEALVNSAIAGCQSYLDSIRRSEMIRFRGRLRGFSPEQEEEVEALTSRIVARLVDGPIRSLEEATGSDPDLFSKTLQTLFVRGAREMQSRR